MGDAARRQTAGQLCAVSVILNNRMSKSLRRYGQSACSDWPQHRGDAGTPGSKTLRRPHLGTKQDSRLCCSARGGTWWCAVPRPQRHVTLLALGPLGLCRVGIQLIDFSARSVRALKVSAWPTVAGALRPTVGYWHVALYRLWPGRRRKNSTGGLESHNPDPNIHSDLATDSL